MIMKNRIRLVVFSLIVYALCCWLITPTHSGSLVLVGGGHVPDNIKDKFVSLAGNREARIVVIPSAAEDVSGCQALSLWTNYNIKSLTSVHALSRPECNDPKHYLKIRHATAVWISGGDQFRLVSLYHDTAIDRELHSLLSRGGVIGGTSAGASCVSKVMMYKGNRAKGFGFIDVVVDQHFNTRDRLGRLKRVIEDTNTGVGIDESTAAVFKDDKVEVIGEGSVTLCHHGQTQIYQNGQIFTIEQ